MELKNIIAQHGKSVGLVFNKYGLKQPTPQSLLLATVLYKNDFINDIESQIAADEGEYSSFTDDEPTPGSKLAEVKTLQNVTVKSKPKKSSKVKNTLLDILQIVATGAGTYAGAKAAAQNNTSATPAAPVNQPLPPEKKKNNAILIAAIVAVVALAIVAFAKHK